VLLINGLIVVLLLHGRGEMAVLPAVSAVLLHTFLWIYGLIVVLLEHGRDEIAVLPTVTSVLLHNTAIDKWTDFGFVNTC